MQKINKPRSGTRNVILMGLVSFFNDISSEMIMPILPLFIQSLGGSGIAIGLIGGLRDGGAELLKVFSGFWSDKLQNRKIFLYIGYFVSALSKLALFWAQAWAVVFACVGIDRFGKSLRDAPRDALIAHSLPHSMGRAFGIHRTFDNLGAIIGSTLAALLMWRFAYNLTTIILIAALISFISLLPLHDIRDIKITAQKNEPLKLGARLPREFKIFTAIGTLFSCSQISYMFFILHAQHILNHGATNTTTMLLYVLFNIFYTAFSMPLGILSDHIGHWMMIACGYAAFALTALGFFYATTTTNLIICFIAYGIALAMTQVSHKAYAATLTNESHKATALGFFSTSTGIAMIASSIMSGILWEHYDHTTLFLFSCATSLVALLLLIMCKNINKKDSE